MDRSCPSPESVEDGGDDAVEWTFFGVCCPGAGRHLGKVLELSVVSFKLSLLLFVFLVGVM